MSFESVILSNHLVLCLLFSSYPQSCPASASFLMSWLSTSGGQNTGASALASVLPINIQDWFPLGLTCLIFFDIPAVQGTLKSSPTPQFKSINSSALSFLYSPTLTSLHDYWKEHSFDYTVLCKVVSLLFNMLSRFELQNHCRWWLQPWN